MHMDSLRSPLAPLRSLAHNTLQSNGFANFKRCSVTAEIWASNVLSVDSQETPMVGVADAGKLQARRS